MVIEGAHQQIPTTPPQQQTVKMLPPPPRRYSRRSASAPSSPPKPTRLNKGTRSWESSRIIRYGAIGSNMPNFNQRLQTDGQPNPRRTGRCQQRREDRYRNRKRAPAAGAAENHAGSQTRNAFARAAPSVLGARPQTRHSKHRRPSHRLLLPLNRRAQCCPWEPRARRLPRRRRKAPAIPSHD